VVIERLRCGRVPWVWPDEVKRTATLSGRLATGGLLAVLLTSCGASGSTTAPHRPISPAPGPTAAPATATTTTVAVLVAPVGLIATAASGRVDIYSDPSKQTPRAVLPNPWALNGAAADPIPQAFRVIRKRTDGWVEVELPQRPNGQRGWIPPREVRLTQTPYRIEVSLAAHHITVLDKTAIVYQGPVATGAASTPTPTGSYYLRVLLKSSNPSSVYGPFAFGLSAHSDALTTFSGSDAEIGLHGNDDASALGNSVSHGCIRMENVAITTLSKILPLGTPVDIRN
jgi:lipoprotein-anchoring transpeptidase ErfK/SrfK